MMNLAKSLSIRALILIGVLAIPILINRHTRASTTALQASTISVTLSCSPLPAGASCIEFTRLLSNDLGYTVSNPLTRANYITQELSRRSVTAARRQSLGESAVTATATAGTTFDAQYPTP